MPDEMNPQVPNLDPVAGQGYGKGGEEDGLGFFGLLSILAARKRLVFGASLAGGVLAATAAFLLPNTYTAVAVIMPPQKGQSAASMLAGQLAPLAAVAGADLGLKSPADLYIGLLGSRTIADHLIAQFGLKALYRKRTDTETRDKLKTQSHFSTGRDSLIRIEVEDTDASRAAAIANAFVFELDAQNEKLAFTDASQRRVFLEKQLADTKSNLAVAEDAMKGTQQRTGVIDVSGQTGVAIASLAKLRAQITANEVSLERLKMGATPENPQVLLAEAELAALRAQLQRLDKSSEQGDPLVAASAIPVAGLAYIRSLRDLKYQEFLFELLAKQYEAARIDEDKAAPALQVVDAAIPPDRKSGPHRSLIILLGGFVAASLAGIAAYFQRDQGGRMATLVSQGQRGGSLPKP